MVKKIVVGLVTLISLGLLFIGVLFACYVWEGVQRSKQLGEERRRATHALAKMGTSGKFYVTNGVFNHLELAPAGKTVNDANFENLEGLTAICGLVCTKARITDAALASLKDLTDLEYLQLKQTEISDEGLKHLVGLVNLEALDLTGTKVTQEGAKYLEHLPKLKYVFAAGTGLSEVKGVTVDCSHIPGSWLGIKYREKWPSKRWLATEP